ncbi:MAG: sugar transporter [Mucilaginibacter sp.]|nr:sugar transporter [Mucilaginibacter sp.]
MEKIKKYLLLLMLTFGFVQVKAQIQSDPAHWVYGLKKSVGNTYEVHLQCTIDNGWHIYAEKQTKDFIGTATKIAFVKVPELTLVGQLLENGKKEIYTIKEAGITNYEYADKVEFIQKITVKPGLKEIKGTITYQTCTHDHCLPERTISFTVPIP